MIEPLAGEEPVDPARVAAEVGEVGLRQARQLPAVGQLLGQVEDREEQVGEGLVLQQRRVLQEAQQEAPPSGEEGPEARP